MEPHAIATPEPQATAAGERALGAGGNAIDARLAADGMAVSASLAGAIADDAERIAADRGLAGVFLPGGAPPQPGDRLRQPALAASLRELAANGARVFYDGALGDRLLRGLHHL